MSEGERHAACNNMRGQRVVQYHESVSMSLVPTHVNYLL